MEKGPPSDRAIERTNYVQDCPNVVETPTKRQTHCFTNHDCSHDLYGSISSRTILYCCACNATLLLGLATLEEPDHRDGCELFIVVTLAY